MTIAYAPAEIAEPRSAKRGELGHAAGDKGRFSGAKAPEFTDYELVRFRECLGGVISPETLAQALELRQAYFNIVSGQEQMPTLAETNALRLDWVRSIEAVEKVALSATSGGDEARADQGLRQLLGAEYGESVGKLVRAVIRLRPIVGKTLDDDANIAGIRSWQAAGLRAVLWFLHEPVEGGVRRGVSLGLAMDPGAGRGAPRLHDFLSVITARRISDNDVKNAIGFMTKRWRRRDGGSLRANRRCRCRRAAMPAGHWRGRPSVSQ